MKKGLVSLIFIIVASTIYSQTLKNYCDTARNYIIDGKQPLFGRFCPRFTAAS